MFLIPAATAIVVPHCTSSHAVCNTIVVVVVVVVVVVLLQMLCVPLASFCENANRI